MSGLQEVERMGKGKPVAAVDPVEPTPQDVEVSPVPVGLECSKCGCRHFFVTDVRPRDKRIMRRRECRNCGKRITTFESVV